MTSKKTGAGKLEIDVQKFRDDCNWKKVIELAEQLKGKPGNNEQLPMFLLGEAKLEQYLEEHPPYDHQANKAKVGLSEAKRLLTHSAGEHGSKTNVSMDAHFLLAKLHFASGEYEDALVNLSEAGLEQLREKQLPSRSLKIIAESYAVHGLALEKVPVATTSKYKIAERNESVLRSLETAGDIALLYFQEQDKLQGLSNWSITTSGSNSPLPPVNEQRIGLLLETALLRVPLAYIKEGKWNEAINRYRAIISAVETSATQTLRLTFARQLAEVLLRSVCPTTYVPVGKMAPESLWKCKRYSGSGLFTPRDVNEEIILLLLIGEAIAVRDAVLSQSPEFRDVRKTAMRNATAVYDLLTICCVQHGLTTMLSESLERALKFSFEDSHIWSQLAFSLIAAGKFHKAILVFKEVARLCPKNPLPCLMASRVCLENLTVVDDGLNWAEDAVSRAVAEKSHLLSRCYLYKGIACFQKWRQCKIFSMKQDWMEQCLNALKYAAEIDINDHLVHFYLALTYAFCRQITQAFVEVRIALRMRGEHLPSLILLVLLLSTSIAGSSSLTEEDSNATYNGCEGALSLLEATLEEYPQNFDLLYVKTLLDEKCHGGEVALVTAKDMLALWKLLYEDLCTSESFPNPVQQPSNFETRSIALSTISGQHLSNEMSDRENGSIYAQSVAAARAEQALSDVTSSLSSNIPRPGRQRAWHVQLRIWLLTGELYVRLGKCDEALACVQEAAALSPASHHVMYLRGLIHEQKNEFSEAKTCFRNATALSPFHVPSLQHLGIVFHYLGSHRLAEKTLRDAVRLDPMAENTWYNLGKVLESIGEYEVASDCMARALQVQITSPIVPFSVVPLCFE